jgi:Rrf2 family transcriptional regulator, cysteine metabolism repressor
MKISQKCYYALQALLELARRNGKGPLSIQEIGKLQEISPLFLQTILRELRQAGMVGSRRGKEGGFLLAKPAREISVGDVIRFFEGDFAPSSCASALDRARCDNRRNCALQEVWSEAARRLSDLYDRATLADLVEREQAKAVGPNRGDYAI